MAEVRQASGLRNAGSVVLHLGVTLLAIAFLFPFFWMISNAIRPNGEVLAAPPQLLPHEWQWGNFVEAFSHLPFGQFFINSVFVSGAITLITLIVSSLAGYAFARIRFFGRDGLFLVYLSTLMVPQAVIVIPLFLMMSRLGWVNTYQGLILPVAFGSFVSTHGGWGSPLVRLHPPSPARGEGGCGKAVPQGWRRPGWAWPRAWRSWNPPPLPPPPREGDDAAPPSAKSFPLPLWERVPVGGEGSAANIRANSGSA